MRHNVFMRIAIVMALFLIGRDVMAHSISGRIVSAVTNEPLEYCGVGLFSMDTIPMGGVATDIEGRFGFRDIQSGDYIIGVRYPGYIPVMVAVRGISGEIDMGDLMLDPQPTVLNEVEVNASPVVRTPTKDVIFPTHAQVEASANLLTLMANLQLPRVVVNPATREVATASGDEIVLRINGVKASAEEIAVLSADDIMRIEWYDGPTLRYEGAMATMNFIVRQWSSGGNLAVDLTQGVSIRGIGEYSVAGN